VALGEVWCTGSPTARRRLMAEAEVLLLDGARRPEHRRLPPPPAPPSEALLVRIATDLVPAMGNAALDRLLGPWAFASPSPRLQQVAVAHGAFLEPDDLPMTAFRRWAGRTPVPPVPLRQRVRGVLHAPLTAWPIREVGARWALGPAVGGGPSQTGVVVDRPAMLPGAPPPAAGHTLLARLVVAPDGPRAVGPIVAPIPIPDASEAWVDLLTLRERLHDRRASTADVLRHRGHLLVQRVLEAAWLAAR